jgi:hypothetical protein
MMGSLLEQQHSAWKAYWPETDQLLLAIGIDWGAEAQWLMARTEQLVVVESHSSPLREAPLHYGVGSLTSCRIWLPVINSIYNFIAF